MCSETTKIEVLQLWLRNKLEKPEVRVMAGNFSLANVYAKTESQKKQ